MLALAAPLKVWGQDLEVMLHFWGAAGAARAAGLAQSMEEAGLGSRELSLGPPILPAPGVARSAQLIALPGEFVF